MGAGHKEPALRTILMETSKSRNLRIADALVVLLIFGIALVYRLSWLTIPTPGTPTAWWLYHPFYALRLMTLPWDLSQDALHSFIKGLLQAQVGGTAYIVQTLFYSIYEPLHIPLTEFWIMFPFSFINALGSVFAYLFCRNVFSRRVGLAAAVILALLPGEILWSRRAYPMSLEGTLLMAFLFFLTQYLRRERIFYLFTASIILALAFVGDNTLPLTLAVLGYFIVAITKGRYQTNDGRQAKVPSSHWALLLALPTAVIIVLLYAFYRLPDGGVLRYAIHQHAHSPLGEYSFSWQALKSVWNPLSEYLSWPVAVVVAAGIVGFARHIVKFNFVGFVVFDIMIFFAAMLWQEVTSSGRTEGAHFGYYGWSMAIMGALAIDSFVRGLKNRKIWPSRLLNGGYTRWAVPSLAVVLLVPSAIHYQPAYYRPGKDVSQTIMVLKTVGYLLRTQGIPAVEKARSKFDLASLRSGPFHLRDKVDIRVLNYAKGEVLSASPDRFDDLCEYYYGLHATDNAGGTVRQLFTTARIQEMLAHYKLPRFDFYVVFKQRPLDANVMKHFREESVKRVGTITDKGEPLAYLYSPLLIPPGSLDLDVVEGTQRFDSESAANLRSLLWNRFIGIRHLWWPAFYPELT